MANESANLLEDVPNLQAIGAENQVKWGSEPECGSKGPDWDIFTVFYKNLQQLSDDED